MLKLSRSLRLCSVCVLLSGCPTLDATGGTGSAAGSGSSSNSVNNCIPLDGVYRVSYSQVSGDCGPQSDELLEYHNGVAATSGTSNCQSGGAAMVSPCELQRDSSCALSDGTTGTLLAHARVAGSLREADANRRLEGSLDVTLTDTTGLTCHSLYSVVAVKIR
jgi:hypothetical protein